MKLDSIESRISRRAALYVFVFGMVVAAVQLAFLQQSFQSQFEKNKDIWVDSFPENILPHLVDSDHFSVQSKVELLQSTDLFSSFRVQDGQGNLITEFGSDRKDWMTSAITDNAGVEWGEFSYSPNTDVIRAQLLRYSVISLLILVGLTFSIYFSLRRVLRGEFFRFENLLVRLQELGGKIRSYSGGDENLSQLELLKPAPNESSDEQRIREVVDGLTEAIGEFSRRVRSAQIDLLASRTQRARAEAVAKTAQMLAHDVRHPFQTLEAGLSLLEGGDIDRRLVRSLREDVRRSLSEVNGLVADVMEIDKTAEPELKSVSAKQLIAECIASFQRSGSDVPDIICRLEHTREIFADPIRLKRVVTNLLSNSIEAAEGSDITISSQSQGDQFVLSVHNRGKWIAEEELEHVFESFYTAGKAAGTGLGLAIVQKIVRDHGGRVECESSQQNGTTFSVMLLHAEAADDAEVDFSTNKIGGSGGLVILVEDNLFLRQAFVASCRPGDVLVFATPEEFWEWRDMHPSEEIASIATDYEFGGLSNVNGEDFARDLARRLPAINVYLFSNHSSDAVDTALFKEVLDKDIDALKKLTVVGRSQ